MFEIAKLAAAFIAATAVLAFFFAARERTDLSSSTFVTVAFDFGSAVWATASRGLWQHTPSILFHSIALWFILRGIRHSADALGPARFFLSLAGVARPPVTVICALLALIILLHFRRVFPKIDLWALPLLVLA